MSFRDRTTLWLPFTKGNRDMWRMTKGYLASSSKISSTHIGKPSRTVRNDVSSYPCRDEWHHSSMHHWSTTNCITQEVFEGTILKILKLLGHRGGISQSSYWTGQSSDGEKSSSRGFGQLIYRCRADPEMFRDFRLGQWRRWHTLWFTPCLRGSAVSFWQGRNSTGT